MIDMGTFYFLCDECPACGGADDPWCEKMQSELLYSGSCEDVLQKKPRAKKSGKRKTGTAYRRKMKHKHDQRLRRIIHNCGYKPAVGYIDWGLIDGVWQRVGKYIKYPKNSHAQRYWKRHSNKAVRKSREIYQGSQYRKCFDYWWTIY